MSSTHRFASQADATIDALPCADATDAGVPVVDLSQDRVAVIAAVAAACRDWGLFTLVGHGLDAALRQAWLDQSRRLFALAPAAKRALSRSFDNPWGFYDRELTKTARDRKEVFDIGPDAAGDAGPFGGVTPWPVGNHDFAATMRALMAAGESIAARLVRIVLAGLGEPEDALDDAFRPAATSYLRLNFYPAHDRAAGDGGAAAGRAVHHHSDAGALTVLLEDGTPGLQVLHGGRWHDVAPRPGALIVNLGDMIQVWSNDRYRAPVHRVLAMTGRERFSAPFFYNPAYRAAIAPLPEVARRTGGARYRPVPWAEFRRRRAEGDYGDYGREVQITDYAA